MDGGRDTNTTKQKGKEGGSDAPVTPSGLQDTEVRQLQN